MDASAHTFATEEAPNAQSNAKIKLEKIDPEIEAKINSIRTVDIVDRKPFISSNGTVVASSHEGSSNADTADNSVEANVDVDEKKSIEPVKSSNEILAELFKVFNATPPEELLNDENLIRKAKNKKHKKEKKKKKKSKEDSRIKQGKKDTEESDSSASSVGSKGGDGNKKHKKQKKHKEEKSREKPKKSQKSTVSKGHHKEREKSKDKEHGRKVSKEHNNNLSSRTSVDTSPKTRRRCRDDADHLPTSSKRKRHAEDRKSDSKREAKYNSFYNGFWEAKHNRSRSRSRNRSCSKSRITKELNDERNNGATHKATNKEDYHHSSEVSLSDEETYLNQYKDDTRTGRGFASISQSDSSRHDKHGGYRHNNFYKGPERRGSRGHSRDRSSCHRRGSRTHRSRTRSRSRDLGIDKKRLLEIARKNAISMFKRGNLPGCAEMSEAVKDKVLLKMRYGGRTVQDLTEFCKKLSNGEDLNDISDLSSEEDSDVDKSGNLKAFNHPFVIKEREPIVMEIPGSKRMVSSKPQENQVKAITMQFPVSSGQQHRLNETWVPVVDPKESLTPLPVLPAAKQSTNIFKAAPLKNIFEKTVPVDTVQEPAFKPTNASATNLVDGIGAPQPTTITYLNPTPPNYSAIPKDTYLNGPPPIVPQPVVAIPSQAPFVPDVPIPSTESKSVFPEEPADNLDVSSIISKRLNAMRRLQENPTDQEALKLMNSSQKEMSSWVSSKYLPGQFTGSTGANMLSARELNSGPQAWARRDQLTSTMPVTGGMGMRLLRKMGWNPGEGLGPEKRGALQPLLLDVKLDKRGLVSQEDNGYQPRQAPTKKRRDPANAVQVQLDLQDKHPVSLLNELTSKRKWTPPLYTLEQEGGPSHKKMFLFSVAINGQTYTPSAGSNTKKDAKVKAARFCLQQIGILPQ